MWNAFKIANFIYLLLSTYIWFAFKLPLNMVSVLMTAFMVVCYATGNFDVKFTRRSFLLSIVVIVYSLYGIFILNLSYGLQTLFTYIPAILLFILPIDRQEDLLDSITKWFAVLLGISMLFFLLSYVVPLPHFTFIPPGFENYYTPYENYYIFMKNTMYDTEVGNVTRFGGPFLEPGHLAMVCSLLLFANRFGFKKNPLLWILLASVLVSFSLAGYVVMIIGFCLIKIRNLITLIGIGVALTCAWLSVSVLWNNGDNPVNILIVERLEFDDNKGIVGNNRTIKQTDYFYKQCVDDGTAWLGVRTQREERMKIRGAGYKVFILRYGFVGVMFVAAIYLMLIPPGTNRRFGISFFILMTMLFMQRAYPGWYSWIISYVLGNGVMRWRNFKGDRLPDYGGSGDDISPYDPHDEREYDRRLGRMM